MSLRPRSYGENLSRPVRIRRVTRLLELPQAGQPFLHFLAKLGEETNSWLGWKRLTLLASTTSHHINALARSAGSARSRRDNQSMHERYWLGQRGQLFSRSLSWEGNPFSWNNLSSYKRAPRQLYSHLHSSVANSRRLQGWCLSLKTFTSLEVQHKTRVHRFPPLFLECLPSCPGS